MRKGFILMSAAISVSIIIVVSFSICFWLKSNNNIRCSSFVRLDLSIDSSQTLLIDGVFNFQRAPREALLLVNGKAHTESGTTTLSREITLSTVRTDNNTGYEYLIKNVNKSSQDNTPDVIFNNLLSEFTVGDKYVFFNDTLRQDDAVLIGGPYSILFMCVRY
ncbi:FidL-like protein [Enterobacter roggenkampii]|uniref:FidL-like protein n=1 Tax=Enterobacter roggenkampii TaxID=1812935 RepID=UPI0032AFBB23